MRLKSSLEGLLTISHSGPGVDPDILRKAGVPDYMACGDGQTLELATLRCVHCSLIVVKNPDRTRSRGYCSKCDGYVCDGCVAIGDCRPFQAVADIVCGSDKELSPLSPLVLRS